MSRRDYLASTKPHAHPRAKWPRATLQRFVLDNTEETLHPSVKKKGQAAKQTRWQNCMNVMKLTGRVHALAMPIGTWQPVYCDCAGLLKPRWKPPRKEKKIQLLGDSPLSVACLHSVLARGARLAGLATPSQTRRCPKARVTLCRGGGLEPIPPSLHHANLPSQKDATWSYRLVSHQTIVHRVT